MVRRYLLGYNPSLPSISHSCSYCPASSLHSYWKRGGVDSLPPPQLHLLLLPVVAFLIEGAGSGCKFACQEVFSSSHSQPPCSQPRYRNSYWGWRTICPLPASWTQSGHLLLTSTSAQPTASSRGSSTNGRRVGPGQLSWARAALLFICLFSFLLPLIFLFCLPLPLQKFFFVYGGNTQNLPL